MLRVKPSLISTYRPGHALKTLHVPTSMVVYAGEGHQFHAPENRLDVNLRMIDWFNKRLPRGNEKAK